MKKIAALVLLLVSFSAGAQTGNIKTYFTRTVDTSVAFPAGNNARQLLNLVDDTLAAYMNRAQATMDIAIYNFDNASPSALIIAAINNAYSRGVRIRIIADGAASNYALTSLNAAIPVLRSPTTGPYAIMHNKFVVFDVNASNLNVPTVWTGSTNWTSAQLTTDANNVIILQDKSLAQAYTTEFEEMWGGSGAQPDTALSKFGPYKTDNTPHEFTIGGKRVECYFSPSDNANAKILTAIQSADYNLFFCMYAFTRTDLASAIVDRATNYSVFTAGNFNDSAGSNHTPYAMIEAAIGNYNLMINHQTGTLLHHKYMIVDEDKAASDALVETGSHNWSTSANTVNDENIVIVHDQLIANQYYQEFHSRFNQNGGTLGIDETGSPLSSFMIYPNPAHSELKIFLQMKKEMNVEISLSDICGRILKSQKLSADSGLNETTLDVNGFSAGIYLVTLQSGANRITSKIILE